MKTPNAFCILITAILLFSHQGYAQNLIPNGDFEDYSCIPGGISESSCLNTWVNPTNSTPDYHHVEGGCQIAYPQMLWGTIEPYSGAAGVGLVIYYPNDYREYLSIALTQELEIYKKYDLSIAITNGHVSNEDEVCGFPNFTQTNYNNLFSNNIGFYFSENPINGNTAINLGFIPQIEITEIIAETQWRVYNLSFIADKNYKYLTFGNFRNNDQTQTQNYGQQSYSSSYYFLDMIELKEDNNYSDLEGIVDMPNVFTPNNDDTNDFFTPIFIKNIETFHISILNRWGNVVFESNDTTYQWDGKSQGEDCSQGVYFWKVQYSDKAKKEFVKSGNLSLER